MVLSTTDERGSVKLSLANSGWKKTSGAMNTWKLGQNLAKKDLIILMH